MPSNHRLPTSFALASLFLGCFFFTGSPSPAQDPWVSFYGGSHDDWAQTAAEFPGGGFVAVGHTDSTGEGDFDFWIFRTDAQGNLLWEKILGGPQEDKCYAVAVTPSGDIYAAGRTSSFGVGSMDIWVIKLDLNGQVLWQKAYGGTGLDFMWPGGIVVTDDGGCALAGATESFGKGVKDVLLFLLNPDGTVRLQKTYGGPNDDRAHALCLSPDGDYVLAGYTSSFGAGSTDGWLMKVSQMGLVRWQETFGGPNEDWFYSVSPLPGGGYGVAGSTKNGKPTAQWDFLLIKVGEDGELVWEKSLGGTQEDQAIAVAASPDGSLTAAGKSKSFGTGVEYDAWVTALDAVGNLRSQRRFFGNQDDFGWGIIPVAEGGFLMAGGTSSYGSSAQDAWLLRTGDDASPGASCISTAATTGKIESAAFPARSSAGAASNPSLTVTNTSAQSAPPFSTEVNCCTLSCSAEASPTAGDAPLVVEFEATAHSSYCTGEAAFFWEFGDGGHTSGQTVSHSYANPGTYTWSLTATAAGVSCQRTGTVTVDPPCRLTCEATTQVSLGQSPLLVNFTPTLWPNNCQGEASYLWDFGDGGTSDLAAPEHIYTATGNFLWNMTVQWDGATCSDQGTVLVTEPCTMTCAAIGTPGLGEAPLEVAFSASVSHAHCNDTFVYLWNFGDGLTSALEKPKHTYAEAGTYSWTLTITSGSTTCSAQGSLVVLPACVLECTATVAPPTGSQPLTVSYSASATAQDCSQPLVYLWDFGDGATSSKASGSHTYASAGTYEWKVDVTSGKGACQESGSIELGAVLPGDCDGDGSVSIGEVQKSVTMFLGLVAPDCGVDCNGDGTVSIGEVQKVINAFLGLPSSC